MTRRLFYIANIRFPTERAHGIQVAQMCAAFARQMRRYDADMTQMGADTDTAVTLLVPERKTFSADPFSYYGVERNFTIEKIPVPDIVRFGTAGFLIESLVFAYAAAKRVRSSSREDTPPQSPPLKRGGGNSIVYTREELPLLFLPRASAFYEAHHLRRSFFFSFLLRRAKGIVSISNGLKEVLVRTGYPRERIMVAPDGYDERQFGERIPQAEARKRLGLPRDKKIALYIGGLESWKGAETLCNASKFLAEDNILVAIIGGTEEEIKGLRTDYPEVLFLGARPYRELPQNQQVADILVIPNSAREEISRSFTSPLKLFAHMASRIPIAASRLPSLTEILSEENAYLVEADDPSSLAAGILAALHNPAESERKTKKAAADVTAYSWDKRAGNVLAYIRWHREGTSS